MTHRHYIADNRRLPPRLVSLLQPYYGIDVSQVRVLVAPLTINRAATTLRNIILDRVWWQRTSTRESVEVLAHELCHVETISKIGVFRHTVLTLRGVLTSLRFRRQWYAHDVIEYERAATAKTALVMARLSPTRAVWGNLLDEET